MFKIAFPKTKNAKTATITVDRLDTLCLTQDLATSACTALQEHHRALQLCDISRQLDTIMSHLGIPSAAQQPQKRSYVSVLTTGVQPPVPVSSQNLPGPITRFDFMLTQKSQDNPVFAELSHMDIIQKIHDTLSDADCWFEPTPCSPNPGVLGKFGPGPIGTQSGLDQTQQSRSGIFPKKQDRLVSGLGNPTLHKTVQTQSGPGLHNLYKQFANTYSTFKNLGRRPFFSHAIHTVER